MANDELTQYEKMIEGISQLANLVRAYYSALRENGFTHKDSMLLCVEYQKSILGMGKQNHPS